MCNNFQLILFYIVNLVSGFTKEFICGMKYSYSSNITPGILTWDLLLL